MEMGLKPGTAEYSRHAEAEIAHYTRIFAESASTHPTLVQPVPPSWTEAERRASDLVRRSTGDDLNGHVTSRLRARSAVRMLSLGSGPGGIELGFAAQAPSAEIVCLDFNPALLEMGRERATSKGLNVRFEQADLNGLSLEENSFDFVFCHASLHHVIELERVSNEIRRCLRLGGELITVDVVTANGYRMWPETRQVVRDLWRTLPARFRVNHTAYGEVRLDDEIWESDTSQSGMECIRSQEILDVLKQGFRVKEFVPYFSICRRFIDTMYGPNYDLTKSLDRGLLEWIWELDVHYITTGELRPETFFGIYSV